PPRAELGAAVRLSCGFLRSSAACRRFVFVKVLSGIRRRALDGRTRDQATLPERLAESTAVVSKEIFPVESVEFMKRERARFGAQRVAPIGPDPHLKTHPRMR